MHQTTWILFSYIVWNARWGSLAEPPVNVSSALGLSLCLGFGTEFAGFAACSSCGRVPLRRMLGFGCPSREGARLFAPKSRHQVISVSSCSRFFLVRSCFWHFFAQYLLCSFCFSLLLLNGGAEQIRKWISSLEWPSNCTSWCLVSPHLDYTSCKACESILDSLKHFW